MVTVIFQPRSNGVAPSLNNRSYRITIAGVRRDGRLEDLVQEHAGHLADEEKLTAGGVGRHFETVAQLGGVPRLPGEEFVRHFHGAVHSPLGEGDAA